MYNPAKHHRRSIRLQQYDYSQEGIYFITFCVQNRQHIFGEIKNGELFLNPLGIIAAEEWAKTPNIRKNISLGEYIIMPNHIHGIISIDYQIKNLAKENIGRFISPSQSIGAIIRGYKGATTKRINNLIMEFRSTGELLFAPTENIQLTGEGSIWQRNYYEHIIRTEKAYRNISDYIINNPTSWDTDKFNKINGK